MKGKPLIPLSRAWSQFRVTAGARRQGLRAAGSRLRSVVRWLREPVEAPPESPLGWRETLARIESHYQLRVRQPQRWNEFETRRDTRRISALSQGLEYREETFSSVNLTVPPGSGVQAALATIEALRSWPETRSHRIQIHHAAGDQDHLHLLNFIPGVECVHSAGDCAQPSTALPAGSLPTPAHLTLVGSSRHTGGLARSKRRGRLLVLVHRVPDLKRGSSAQDIYWFARHASSQGFEVMVVSTQPRFDEEDMRWTFRAAGIAVPPAGTTAKDVQRSLPAAVANADAIAVFSKELVVPTRRLMESQGTRAPLLFLPLDLKRFPMRAIMQADLGPDLAEFGFTVPTAEHLTKLTVDEDAAIAASDVTAVISTEELKALVGEWPPGKVTHLPMLRTEPSWVAGLTHTPRVVFVGGFNHPPNYIALQWFLRQVWPLVLVQRPNSQLQIFGADLRDKWRDEWSLVPGVSIEGPYEAEETPYRGDVVAIAPLRYGGGTKGKVVGAVGHGAVVVGTKFATQGLPDDFQSVIVQADAPDEFAEKLLEVLASPELRQEIRERGQEAYRRSFSSVAGAAAVKSCLDDLILSVDRGIRD